MIEKATVCQRMLRSPPARSRRGRRAPRPSTRRSDDEDASGREDDPVERPHENARVQRQRARSASASLSEHDRVEARSSGRAAAARPRRRCVRDRAARSRSSPGGHQIRRSSRYAPGTPAGSCRKKREPRVDEDALAVRAPRAGRPRAPARPDRAGRAARRSSGPIGRRSRGRAPAPSRRSPPARSCSGALSSGLGLSERAPAPPRP